MFIQTSMRPISFLMSHLRKLLMMCIKNPAQRAGRGFLIRLTCAARWPVKARIVYSVRHVPLSSVRRIRQLFLIRSESFLYRAICFSRFAWAVTSIEEYKETLEFAGLLDDNTMSEMALIEKQEEKDAEEERRKSQEFMDNLGSMNWFGPRGSSASAKTSKEEPPRMRELPITLPSLNIAVVKIPEKMSESDYAFLETVIRGWKQALVGNPESEQAGEVSSE